jgi:hypothetical protein
LPGGPGNDAEEAIDPLSKGRGGITQIELSDVPLSSSSSSDWSRKNSRVVEQKIERLVLETIHEMVRLYGRLLPGHGFDGRRRQHAAKFKF